MNPGELNRRIRILRKSYENTEKGGQVETWPVYVALWAGITNLKNTEFIEAKAVNATDNIDFKIRYFKGITTDMKIAFAGQEYNILDINDIDDRHKEMLITAQAVVNHEQF